MYIQPGATMLSARCVGLSITVFCLGPVSLGLLHHSVLVGKEVEEIIVSAIIGAETKEQVPSSLTLGTRLQLIFHYVSFRIPSRQAGLHFPEEVVNCLNCCQVDGGLLLGSVECQQSDWFPSNTDYLIGCSY